MLITKIPQFCGNAFIKGFTVISSWFILSFDYNFWCSIIRVHNVGLDI